MLPAIAPLLSITVAALLAQAGAAALLAPAAAPPTAALLAQAGAPPVVPGPAVLEPALDALAGADLVLFDEPPRRGAPHVVLATRVRAPAEKLRALLGDPAAYQRAIPSFRKAETVQESGGARLVAWELEIPLWNLSGRLWLRPREQGVELELVEGDFAPGLFRITVAGGERALLTIAGRANVRDANWLTKRLVARNPVAEPAMLAAASWVLLRALTLEAEGKGPADARRWPKTGIQAPAPGVFDGAPLAAVAGSGAASRAIVGAVRTRADGRLSHVELAARVAAPAERVRRGLEQPRRWQAVPGWGKVAQVPADGAQAPGKPAQGPARGAAGAVRWEVDSSFPFVDFDSVWEVQTGSGAFRARAVGGDWRGGSLGWDVVPGAGATSSIAVFSVHPRLEKSGYMPRKFIEAEPLLEHGLALGLAYVDAVSLLATFRAGQGAQ